MRSASGIVDRLVAGVLVGVVLSGCSGITSRQGLLPRHLGFRPDVPLPGVGVDGKRATTACEEYKAYVVYAQELQESYHSRATQNRGWIYVAGVLGLATIAATGGLAAAAAASVGTLALLSISGGFASGTLAVIDNSALADIYTIAANKVDVALKDGDRLLIAVPIPPAPYNDPSCKVALDDLKAKVSEARVQLEAARTDSAKLALQRVVEQQKALRQYSEQLTVALQDPAIVSRKAAITDIPVLPATIGTGNTEVKLEVSNILLGTVPGNELRVRVGNTEVPVKALARKTGTDDTVWFVTFDAPATNPGSASPPEYDPILLVGRDRRVDENKTSPPKRLRYALQ
jgi:hypothetical protein